MKIRPISDGFLEEINKRNCFQGVESPEKLAGDHGEGLERQGGDTITAHQGAPGPQNPSQDIPLRASTKEGAIASGNWRCWGKTLFPEQEKQVKYSHFSFPPIFSSSTPACHKHIREQMNKSLGRLQN